MRRDALARLKLPDRVSRADPRCKSPSTPNGKLVEHLATIELAPGGGAPRIPPSTPRCSGLRCKYQLGSIKANESNPVLGGVSINWLYDVGEPSAHRTLPAGTDGGTGRGESRSLELTSRSYRERLRDRRASNGVAPTRGAAAAACARGGSSAAAGDAEGTEVGGFTGAAPSSPR